MEPSSPTRDPDPTRTASVSIAITCPAWCEISAEGHASQLWENEGRCVHQTRVTVRDPAGKRIWDQAPRFCSPVELSLSMTTNPAGREVESADVWINGHESNVEQVLLVAAAMADLVTLYRETPGTR